MQLQEYVRPATLEEAYELLQKGKNNWILGGCTFLRKINRRVKTGIDLSDCGLSYIVEEADAIRIGAYTPLRELELSPVLQQTFGSVFQEVLQHLIGVQLRNAITIGGHMYSRFGFSDINPLMIALNAKIRLFHGGVVPYQTFMQAHRPEKDILVEVILPKEQRRCKVQMMRTSYNDYSLFSLAVSRTGSDWRIVAGVCPGRPQLAERTMSYVKEHSVTRKDAEMLAEMAVSELRFGSNFRASADYRQDLCRTFVKRAVKELADED